LISKLYITTAYRVATESTPRNEARRTLPGSYTSAVLTEELRPDSVKR